MKTRVVCLVRDGGDIGHNAASVTAQPILLPLPERIAPGTYDDLRRAVRAHPRGATVVLDCAGLARIDALGAARLLRVIAEGRAAGVDVRLTHLGDELRRALAQVDPAILEPSPEPPRRGALEAIGTTALDAADAAATVGTLLSETVVSMATPFGRRGIKWDRTIQQMALIGVDGVPIVVFISFLIGVVLALNGAQQLRQFGAAIFIANLVGISMTREMGPLITAVIVAGRTGSAIAAEIGSMVVSEEVDAMRTMALNPVRFLVVPKVVALALMMPLLTAVSNVAGIFGGWVIGVFMLDLGSPAYLTQTVQALLISDVVTGLVKSVVFAILIGTVGAYYGFSVRGGPEAVGRATTAAVVTSIILCILANAGFTAFFYYTG
jgi:phospholipid/cholesterol/gamma-HCH transport system permease protein